MTSSLVFQMIKLPLLVVYVSFPQFVLFHEYLTSGEGVRYNEHTLAPNDVWEPRNSNRCFLLEGHGVLLVEFFF